MTATHLVKPESSPGNCLGDWNLIPSVQRTTTRPFMFPGCATQLYRYTPGAVNLTLCVIPTPPVSALLGKFGVPTDCTLCRTAGPLIQVHVTSWPTATVSTAGSTEKFCSL